MLLILLLPVGIPVQLLALGLAFYLAVVELRDQRPHWKWWVWWLLFVALTHFIGYLILRGYVAYRRWHSARA